MPAPFTIPQPRPAAWSRRARRAFTMVEMMVVVGLIGILAAIAGFSLNGVGQGNGLRDAQSSLLIAVDAARAAAQRYHTRARLIVFADKNAVPDTSPYSATINPKVLRYYGVIYAISDDPAVPTMAGVIGKPYQTWVATTDGAMLPDGLYFVPSHPSTFATDLPSFAQDTKSNAISDAYTYPTETTLNDHPGITTGLMQISFPLSQAVEQTGDWYYFIEFAPDGFYYNANGNDNIFVGSAATPTQDTIDFLGSNTPPNLSFTGIQLRMLGGAEGFRSSADFLPAGAAAP